MFKHLCYLILICLSFTPLSILSAADYQTYIKTKGGGSIKIPIKTNGAKEIIKNPDDAPKDRNNKSLFKTKGNSYYAFFPDNTLAPPTPSESNEPIQASKKEIQVKEYNPEYIELVIHYARSKSVIIPFKTGSSQVTDKSILEPIIRAVEENVSENIGKNKTNNKISEIQIIGRADQQTFAGISTVEERKKRNMILSSKRAYEVSQLLIKNLDSDTLKQIDITIIPTGENILDCDINKPGDLTKAACHSTNRKVYIKTVKNS